MSQPADTMRCEVVDEHIEAFVDGELATDLAIRLRRHLDGCRRCTAEVERARQTLTALRGLPEFDAPPQVIDNVKSEIADDVDIVSVRSRRQRKIRFAAAAAVALAIGGGVASLRLAGRGPDPEAIRAATEVEYAIACLGGITRRANHLAAVRVIDQDTVSSTIDGVTRTLDLDFKLHHARGSEIGPDNNTSKGSS